MKKLALFLLLINFIFVACQTVVDIDIPLESPKLVLNSILANEESIMVHLSESRHILDEGEFQNVNGAGVKIYENGEFLSNLYSSGSGFGLYSSDSSIRVKSGNTYRVEVSKNGFQSIDAEARVPLNAAKILAVDFDTAQTNTNTYSQNNFEFDIEIEDEAGVENFYELLIIEEGYTYYYDYNTNPPTVTDSSRFMASLSLESSDPSLEEYQSYGESILFNDGFFDGKKYHIKVTSSYYSDFIGNKESQSKYTIVLRNTSKSYYLYRQSVELQAWVQDDPFAQPVQIYNNINNGFGIFAAYNEMKIEIKVGG